MIPKNAYNVSALQAYVEPVLILKVDGLYITNTPIAYLQIHDSAFTPPAGAVPLKEEPINGNNGAFYFEFKRGDLVCSLGCYVVISTTSGTLTASTDKMNVSVEVSANPWLSGTTQVGDLTTALGSSPIGLGIWTNGAGNTARKRLYALEVDGTNLTGVVLQYIMIFGKTVSTVTAGDACGPESCFPIAPGGTALLVNGNTYQSVQTLTNGRHFGDEGFDPVSSTIAAALGSAPVYTNGCSVVVSSTPQIYTACNGTFVARAEYK